MKNSAIVISAASVTLSLLAPHFSMASDTVTKSITVSYADLNLSNPAGASALYQRIRGAARRVCTVAGESPYEVLGLEKRQCIHQAIDQAIMKVNSPVLVAMYKAKNSRASS
jgi:UrcA family protein